MSRREDPREDPVAGGEPGDPDHEPRPVGPGDPRLPADVDAAFAGIVADWASSGTAPRWPDGDDVAGATSTAAPPEPARREHPAGRGADPEDDEHYVPPEPPPLPRVSAGSVAGLLLLVLGVAVVGAPSLVGGSTELGLVLGLVVMTGGLGWLVFGLRRPLDRPGQGDGPDDGAIL